jgi:hypothetical protein
MIEPDPTILLSIPVGTLFGLWLFRKYREKQKIEAEWKKNKGKYKYKDFRY